MAKMAKSSSRFQSLCVNHFQCNVKKFGIGCSPIQIHLNYDISRKVGERVSYGGAKKRVRIGCSPIYLKEMPHKYLRVSYDVNKFGIGCSPIQIHLKEVPHKYSRQGRVRRELSESRKIIGRTCNEEFLNKKSWGIVNINCV